MLRQSCLPRAVEAITVAREIEAATGPKSKGSGTRSEMYGYAKDSARPHLKDWITARLSLSHSGPCGADRASAQHLAALQQLRIERAAAPPGRRIPIKDFPRASSLATHS